VKGHEFVTYADADLAGDIGSRKSTTGFVVVLAGGLVSWMSKLQSTVALSTAEAETNASVEAVKQIMHFRLFMRELGMGQDGPSVVFEDNQEAFFVMPRSVQRSSLLMLSPRIFGATISTISEVGWRSKISNKIFSS
jgi:hypothetical protein